MTNPSQYRCIRTLKTSLARLLDTLLPILEFPRSNSCKLISSIPQIIERDVVVIASFKPETREILELVKVFTELEFETVLIRNIVTGEIPLAETLHFRVLDRENTGFDFGAYRDSMQFIGSPRNLILMNTSLLWNSERLYKIVKKLKDDYKSNRITYLTESLQSTKHGQSFFMHANFDDLTVSGLKDFLESSTKNWRFKRSAVKLGEKAIYKYFESDPRISIDFIFPYELVTRTYEELDIDKSEDWILKHIQSNVCLNPTQHLWLALDLLGFPGYKKTLLRDNPANLRKMPNLEGNSNFS